jgi:hypothetical protein
MCQKPRSRRRCRRATSQAPSCLQVRPIHRSCCRARGGRSSARCRRRRGRKRPPRRRRTTSARRRNARRSSQSSGIKRNIRVSMNLNAGGYRRRGAERDQRHQARKLRSALSFSCLYFIKVDYFIGVLSIESKQT